ncbi:hypothetical protein B0O99DRAFT_606645 [Bisporella sp. PMI_857]|nr:hypothetical protein B0O99DRAFT_606645 [Bisporella sp. PMI_857]
MLFPTLSLSLLGFASLSVAAPHLHSRFENNAAVAVRQPGSLAERGITWKRDDRGRGRGGDRNDDFDVIQDITVTQFQNIVISDEERNRDVQLVQLIQERLIVVDNSREFRDNVRRNTFRNRRDDNNNEVNTVIIVVTEIVDNRDGRNERRYVNRRLQSNENAQNQVFVVIRESESDPFTSDEQPSRVQELLAQSSATPQQQFGFYDPNAQAKFDNDSLNVEELLPSGASAPRWSNAFETADPAIILDSNPDTAVFVQFLDENGYDRNNRGRNRNNNNNNNNNDNDVAIVVNIQT